LSNVNKIGVLFTQHASNGLCLESQSVRNFLFADVLSKRIGLIPAGSAGKYLRCQVFKIIIKEFYHVLIAARVRLSLLLFVW
jgi:hypothetical protein